MFKITARTVLELGSELISSDIIAFYELIKNGFDAKSTSGVTISFKIVLRRYAWQALTERCRAKEDLSEVQSDALAELVVDAPEERLVIAQKLISDAKTHTEMINALQAAYDNSTIEISDTGVGMSLQDLSQNFLVIGTANRKREVDQAIERGDKAPPYLGEKGLGRLSAMRLGEKLRVETAKANDARMNILDIDWRDFSDIDAMLSDIPVDPKPGQKKQTVDWSGTIIIIGALSEDWTTKRVKHMVDYDFARLSDPFLDVKNRPRIVINWNGERLTIPSMNQNLLAQAHARMKGVYEIGSDGPKLTCTLEALDLGFDHPKEIDTAVVATPDLVGALIGPYGEIPDSALRTIGPFSFEAHWYNRRRLGGVDGIGEMKQVKELQEKWSGILLFREGFRVFPYGDDDDDWLALDRKALRRSGYTLNKTQFIGKVDISRTANPQLVDQTNREGLRETPEQQAFIGVMQYVVQDLLFPFMRNIEKQYKSPKVDLSNAKTEIDTLERRARTALKRLRSVPVPKEVRAETQTTIEDLEQTLFEFAEFAQKARARIEEVEEESRQMLEMAGVGLMVEVVAHELARASENALENLESLKGKSVPAEIRNKLEALRSEMKSLSKRVRILDPMSVSGRQRQEVFSLNGLLEETRAAHEAQFERERIVFNVDVPQSEIHIKAVKGMIVQVVENLISNSTYWLATKSARERTFVPTISITLLPNPPTLIYEDNGPGISPANAEKVFQVFFSLKEKAKRRGLGLFIAKECAEHNGGTLTLDPTPNPKTDRLHRFILELPDSAIVR